MNFRKRKRALALAACVTVASACSSHNNSSVSPSTPVPTASPTPNPNGSPIPSLNGVAYIPDGGVDPALRGFYVIHFEDVGGNLLPSTAAAVPASSSRVNFPASVGPFAFAADGSTMIAATGADSVVGQPLPPAGAPFFLAQAVFGLASAAIVPVGSPYNAALPPSPPASPVPTPTPLAAAIVPNITGAAMLGTGTSSVGLITGPAATGIVGLTSLSFVPPLPGGFVPYNGGAVNPLVGPRYNLASGQTSAQSVVLARGPGDIVSFTITFPGNGYQFTAAASNAMLGSKPNALLGKGGFLVDPVSTGTAFVIQAPGPNDVSSVTGLPGALNVVSTVTLPSHPHTIASNSGATLLFVGTDNGFYVLSVGAAAALTLQTPYLPAPGALNSPNAPTYQGCDGASHSLQSVSSIGVSPDDRYVAALGQTADSCPGGNGSLVVVPIVDTSVSPTPTPSPAASATPTPGPKTFVQNNLPAQNIDTDYMRVR